MAHPAGWSVWWLARVQRQTETKPNTSTPFTVESAQRVILALLHALLLLPIINILFTINEVPQLSGALLFFIVTQVTVLIFAKWWLYFPVQLGISLYTLYQLFPPLFLKLVDSN